MSTINTNNIITNFLTTEHAVFCELFDELEHLLPEVRTVAEVRLLGRLVSATVHSLLGNPCRLRYGDATRDVKIKKGKTFQWDGQPVPK